MSAAYLDFDAVEARIAALDATVRRRDLSTAEAIELGSLLNRRRIKICRLDRQIAAARAKLQRLEAIRERTAA